MHHPDHIDFIPDHKTSASALESSKTLAEHIQAKHNYVIHLLDNNHKVAKTKLPANVMRLFVELLEQIAAGNPLSIIPLEKELSTQQAANLLNVSRPFFVKLLDNNKIPHRKVGKHRRVNAADVLAYKKQSTKRAKQALGKLATQAQDLKMGYDIDE